MRLGVLSTCYSKRGSVRDTILYMRIRKKFGLTVAVFLAGTAIAIIEGSSLGEYTAFAMAILATFGASDVLDKKYNGGGYDVG